MKLTKDKQVFNLMNTNGRRSDVINAYTIYLDILKDLERSGEVGQFNPFPKSWNQFRFYEEAIRRSPDVFKQYSGYEKFKKALEEEEVREAFEKGRKTNSKDPILALKNGKELLKTLDGSIEARARHYTSNLTKLGLIDKNYTITEVGYSFLEGKQLKRSSYEELLPIDDVNLLFIRQLLKLRIYSGDKTRYYSPMHLAMYVLLKKDVVEEKRFLSFLQTITPYFPLVNIDENINQVVSGEFEEFQESYIDYSKDKDYIEIDQFAASKIREDTFLKIFKNRKSGKKSSSYYEFYKSLYDFLDRSTESNLEKLRESYTSDKSAIDKAFNFGTTIFIFQGMKGIDDFKQKNSESPYIRDVKDLNTFLYIRYSASKRYDSIVEYSDTLMRILRVTGIISFKNGLVQLRNKDVWLTLLKKEKMKHAIFGVCTEEEYEEYENGRESIFYKHSTIEEILDLDAEEVRENVKKVNEEYLTHGEEDVRSVLSTSLNTEFVNYIESEYPLERLMKILSMFSDRKNDNEIKKEVQSDASIPTIYEYIIGMCWYHISSKTYNVLESFNLTLNADFIPETHAGGGQGDIIVEYKDEVVQLEVTLMNKQAQKRAEWEPVLRHAVNLSIDAAPKEVTTIFIADELDYNTINIWRAVASVPLKSSREVQTAGVTTENVIIMPLSSHEFIRLMERGIRSDTLLESIKESYRELSHDFNDSWRSDVLGDLFE